MYRILYLLFILGILIWFLLNKENKVVLIGNPTHNEKLNKLYLTEIDK